MKKIAQGTFEVFTSKDDAINKLREFRATCQEKNSKGGHVEFKCSKDGKIVVFNPQSRLETHFGKLKLIIQLNGEVVEQNNKTSFVNYYTFISNFAIFKRLLAFVIAIIICILYGLFTDYQTEALVLTIICIVTFVLQIISIIKEKKKPSLDSNILIEVLKTKVNTINTWDK